jgi:hypothetical protein
MSSAETYVLDRPDDFTRLSDLVRDLKFAQDDLGVSKMWRDIRCGQAASSASLVELLMSRLRGVREARWSQLGSGVLAVMRQAHTAE